MRKATLRQRLGYAFDGLMSKGTSALLGGLAAVTVLVIVVAALLVAATSTAPDGEGVVRLLWLGLMHTLDSGAVGGDAGGPFFLGVMLAVSVAGMFVFGALIGILNTGLESRLEELRKGRSIVLESGHTLILGWGPQVFNIISELVVANASRKEGAAIVVLADREKVEMEDEIRERVPDTGATRIVCRSGSPVDLTDLEIGSPHDARSIIVLPEGPDPDTHAIKSVLAVTNNPGRREGPYHVVTQMQRPENVDVIRMIGARDHVLPILGGEVIARVAAQTVRQSGLSAVYTELLDFDGDEIYFHEEPALIGRSFCQVVHAFESCSALGLRRADGSITLNPPMDSAVAPGDRVILLAEDDDRIALDAQSQEPDESLMRTSDPREAAGPERALILGWNDSGPTIVCELDHYVAPGSQVTVVADADGIEEQVRRRGDLANQELRVRRGDVRDRALLEELRACDYDHVIVLAYDHLGAQEADAITLVTLLHLRDIAERDDTPFSIVSQMLDLRNRELAEVTKVDDFIVSEHLVGLMVAQLSENAELADVFDDLFSAEGSEVYLKPVGDYVAVGGPVGIHTVAEAACRHGETFLGYRIAAECHDAARAYGVRTNPRKSERVTFAPGDRVIVIAEE